MKLVFLHQGCLKKSTVLGHAEQFANNIYPEHTVRRESITEECGNTFGYTGIR
jgi:hypothetical protein